MQRRKLSQVLALTGSVAAIPWPALAQAPSTDLYAARDKTRLLVTASDWASLKQRIAQEPDLAAYHASLLEHAQAQMALPPVEYRKVGRRLLSVSRTLLQRALILGYAWQMTGQTRYAQSGIANLLAAADFPDWNPSHFLDVGEATAGIALGMDWLQEVLDTAQRERLLRSIVDKGLRPALDPSARHNSWHRAHNNWNQVCFGGLTLGALAVLSYSLPQETSDIDSANKLLALARAGIANGLKPYAPDGVYPEGPDYWGYGTSYQVLMIAALRVTQGNSWQMEGASGFMESALAYVQVHGIQGVPFNFADGPEWPSFEPALFWMARELKQSSLLRFTLKRLEVPTLRRGAIRGQRFAPLAALWWPEARERFQQALPLNWYGNGECPVAVFRQSWADDRSLYFAIKGGSASTNHAHMDAGSFVFERDGVRWGIDLGKQDYESLESKGVDLWNKRQNAQRWQVFRLSNHAHSTLTVDEKLHQVEGHAKFTAIQLDGPELGASLDASSVFRGQATEVLRSVSVKSRAVMIRDELRGLRPGAKVRWQMPTRANIASNGSRAILNQSGQQLEVTAVDAAASFFSYSIEKPAPDFNVANPGVNMLAYEVIAGPDGRASIAISLGG